MPEREWAKKRSETRRKSRNQKSKNAKLYSFEEEPENRVRIRQKLNQNGRERDQNGASRFLKGSRPTPSSGSRPTLVVGLTRPTAGSPVRTVVGLAISAPLWVRDPRVSPFLQCHGSSFSLSSLFFFLFPTSGAFGCSLIFCTYCNLAYVAVGDWRL
jgi:hypothetical protein